jgi:hypothetical protein
MPQPSDSSKPADLPLTVRIMPTRSALWAGFDAGVASMVIFGWLAHDRNRALPSSLVWIVIGVSALIALGSGLRLLVQLPVIEASELGIAVWPYGPYRRPFFAPWSRVRAVALTQVRRANEATGAAARDALGVELNHDEQLVVPRSPSSELPVEGAARADLAWSNRSISGDLQRWVELLQQMKSEASK